MMIFGDEFVFAFRTNIDRLDHKFKFMDDFQNYINELKKQTPNLIICGDYNICHEAIDIHDPVQQMYLVFTKKIMA
jgi:exonuclease III